MDNGDSVLGMSGKGKSSFKAGTSDAGRGAAAPVGVLSPELDGSSGLATISLPGVDISNTEKDSAERRSCDSGLTRPP